MFKRFSILTEILLGPRKKHLFVICLILIPNTFAAFLDGLTFPCILLALSSLGSSAQESLPMTYLFWKPSWVVWQPFPFFLSAAIVFQSLRSILNYVSQIGITRVGTKIQENAQKRVYQQILELSFSYVHRYHMGELLQHAKIASTLLLTLMDCFNRIIVSFFGALASLIVMFMICPLLSFIALGIFGLLGFAQKWTIVHISRHSDELARHAMEFSKHTAQMLNGLRVIHTFHRYREVMDRIANNLREVARATRFVSFWNHSIVPMNEIFGVVVIGVFLMLGRSLLSAQVENPLPLLLTFITLTYRLHGRLQVCLATVGSVAADWGQILRLERILGKEGKEFSPTGGIICPGLKRCLSFVSVTLHYKGMLEPAVRGLEFSLHKGGTFAFVGASGAGKSSVADLLSRLYDPTEGAILLDGRDLRDYTVGSWREKLGVVSQDIFLFNQTIEENIRFGAPTATTEEVVAAARLAGADLFIASLPQRYQTLVGEKGYRLSGGEKQRVTLARALLRDPEILVLDEATSNLDSLSEKLIQTAIDRYRGVKTVVIVAHRLSTVRNADQIFVIDRGKIIETGTHQELLAKRAVYANLWETQTGLSEDSQTPLGASRAVVGKPPSN